MEQKAMCVNNLWATIMGLGDISKKYACAKPLSKSIPMKW